MACSRIAEIDKTLLQHDAALRDIYRKLLPLLEPPPSPPKGQVITGVMQDTAPYFVSTVHQHSLQLGGRGEWPASVAAAGRTAPGA